MTFSLVGTPTSGPIKIGKTPLYHRRQSSHNIWFKDLSCEALDFFLGE